MKHNVLAVGAHPDDVELGCGGALSKHIAAGDNVYVIVVTQGDRGKHRCDLKECFNSLKKFGIKEQNIIIGNYKDTFVRADGQLVNFIEKYIKKFNIDKIYTHDSRDRHQDHRNTSLAVSSAARKVSEIFLFQGPSTTSSFEPHYFIELGKKDIERKLSALKSYRTQIRKGIVNLTWVKNLAIVNGISCNSKTNFAEAYAINHILRGGKDV